MMDAIGMPGRPRTARAWSAGHIAAGALSEPAGSSHGDARAVAPRAKPMREAMPEVAGVIDTLRDVFGRDSVDASLSLGLAGEPMFYATEAGHEVGTRVTVTESDAVRALRVRDRYYCNGCDGRCVGTDTRCTGPTSNERDARGGFDTGF